MNSIDFVKLTLEMSSEWILGLAADMRDAPLTAPTAEGGNHPLWCLGHLTYSEANLVFTFAQGKENPLASWKDLFDQGSVATDDASIYPSYDEVLAKFQEIRADTLVYLDGLSDADLDKPSHAPEEMQNWFGTIGQCMAAIPVHFGFHGGQIADARRAAGRSPLMG